VPPSILAIIGMAALAGFGLGGCAARDTAFLDGPGYGHSGYYHPVPPPRVRTPHYWTDDRIYRHDPTSRGWDSHRAYRRSPPVHQAPAPRRENWSQERLRQHWEQQWNRQGRPP
jgi:hypothetical protein